ncbi:MAG TPA: hypothetical protein VHC90_14345 [Bryobacteraceae bacterium]|nr:hypothetical protein [Bryobacteraceae bacterium]
MSAARSHAARLLPWPLVAAGIICLWIALRRFDRLSLLDAYQLPENRGIRAHRSAGVFLAFAAGLLLLIAAVVLILQDRTYKTTTLLGTNNSPPSRVLF